jgi:hypothetical protein
VPQGEFISTQRVTDMLDKLFADAEKNDPLRLAVRDWPAER